MSNLFNNPDNLVDMVRQVLSGKPIEEKEQKVAAYDKKGKQVGLYKNMADAKKLKPGHTYKPHKEELDPVNKKAVKKKFDDRKDKDIDNDGDVDSTDKYLHKRRKAISKEINEEEPCPKCGKVHINASHCMEEVELDEAKDEDSDGEKMTDAQKQDMDGDGEKDKGEKKKKKKKDDEDDEPKADKINTEPETDEVKTMMSEDEMTPAQKTRLDKMKKKYEGGEMHKAMKAKYGDKADDVFYGKLTKMAMGEEVDMNEDKKELDKISKELGGASKMHKGQSDRVKKIADKMDEAKDEEKDTNLIMQLRKAVSLRGNKVTFADGKSVVVSEKDAQKFMSMFSKLKKPAEKEMMMKSAAKSPKHFKMALSGRVEKPKSGGPDLPKLKSEK